MHKPPAPPLPPLREVIAEFGLRARHSLGQHFLLDGNLCARIARTPGNLSGCSVIEVGPGPGGLTRAILDTDAAHVVAIEKDRRCIEALGQLGETYQDRLRIIEADALEADFENLAPPPRHIIANLPYNVATPLLLKWLRGIEAFDSLTLMFQKEVADRLSAKPRSKAYGRLTIVTQWQCEVGHAFNVDKRAFTPPPKVTSSVVLLKPRERPVAPASWPAMEAVTAAAFGQRRKMLRSSLKAVGLDPVESGIRAEARAEELEIADFCALARALERQNRADPG